MMNGRTFWMALGALATACSPLDMDPAERADSTAATPDEETSNPAQQPAWSTSSPDAGTADTGSTSTSPPFDDTQVCIVKGGRKAPGEETTWRETWDATTRVRTRYETAAPDSPQYLAWRYDTEARVLAYVGSNFQHDYQYDEHGTVMDFRLSYSQPDLFTRYAGEPWMGTAVANEYSARGVLLASTLTPYGEGNATAPTVRKTFAQDEQGRCVRVETTGGHADTIETREYDTAGRLSTVHVESSGSLTFNGLCKASTQTHTYDAAGRVERVERRCEGQPDAQVIWQQTHVYADDGTVTIETASFDTDVLSDIHRIEVRSPGCASMDAELESADSTCDPLPM